MKKISLFFLSMILLIGVGRAQTGKNAWNEMQSFESIMTSSFQTAEKGNMTTLKAKAPELYRASKVLSASTIPAEYKETETKATLEKLMIKCNDLWAAVHANAADSKVKGLISEVKSFYKKVNTECKKAVK